MPLHKRGAGSAEHRSVRLERDRKEAQDRPLRAGISARWRRKVAATMAQFTQRLPFDFAHGRRAGLTSGAPTALAAKEAQNTGLKTGYYMLLGGSRDGFVRWPQRV